MKSLMGNPPIPDLLTKSGPQKMLSKVTRCRFWDGDDNRFSILQNSPNELEVTLGRGLQNYHFEP